MYQSAVRHRPFVDKHASKQQNDDADDTDWRSSSLDDRRRRPGSWSPVLSGSVWLLVFSFYAVLLLYIHTTSSTHPEPLNTISAQAGQFVEERARKHLMDLTQFGSRPVGSLANEKQTVEYLLNEIEAIRRDMETTVHQLDVDVQHVSGTFSLDFLGQFTSYYDNVNNIVVRLSPKHGSSHSLLVNCHYDTSINTTGASDDTVSCCVMLEVLRVMSHNKVPYLHSITFIFNGAEENILQASHGFITKHPWAKEVRAFVNLEACGAGGKQLLFQSGPEHPWLVSAYAKHAPHPFASIVGQELFQSGLIPSDTDYRIYRDYGGLPGLDIAYIYNGYVYHTVFDRPEMIPPGSIQQAGDNVLAVVSAIVDSPLLADPSDYRHGRLVFFDFLGHFMIVYPMRIGTVINSITICIVLAWIGSRLFGRGNGYRGARYLKQLSLATVVMVVSWIVAVLFTVAVSFILDWTNHAMSWYSNTWLVFGLYMAPSAGLMLLTCSVAKRLFYQNAAINVWDVEAVYFDVALLFSTCILAVMTYFDLCSAIMALIPVLLPTAFRLGAVQLFRLSPNDHQRTFMTVHLLGQLIPNILMMLFIYVVLLMCIPIMGRVGDVTIPDLVVGVLSVFGVIIVLMWQVGLVFVTRSMRWITGSLIGIFIVTLIAVIFTPVGFPYRANIANPTRQRLILHHLERNYRDINGDVVHSDSGIMHIPFDRNAIRHLSSVPLLSEGKSADCADMPYCGWPYYFPMVAFIHVESIKYLPASRLDGVVKPLLVVISRTNQQSNLIRITMSIDGPSHINIYMTPRPGVDLVGWSVGDGHPKPTEMPSYVQRPHYFIFYSYGTKPQSPMELSIDIQVVPSFNADNGFVDIALGGHYITVDGMPYMTSDLENYVNSLPDWTTSLAWPASYDSWVV